MQDFELPSGKNLDYSNQLMSIAPKEWLCSELSLSEQTTLLPVKINTEEGLKLGLEEGQVYSVENQFGAIRCLAEFDGEQRKDLVVIPRGG